MVRFYAAALKARKPFGGTLDVALAPDSNINRATRSNTLGTVIGDFTLDQDAKAKSGLGLALRGQTYFRAPIEKNATLLVRANGSGDLYRDERFDDILLGIQAGPEYALGADRLTLAAGPTWRWYGLKPYSTSVGVSADFIHPMGKTMQGRLDLGVTHTANRRNALQTGDVFSLSAGLDRAISARLGGGVQAFVNRTKARDAGWSDVTGVVRSMPFARLPGPRPWSAPATATWKAMPGCSSIPAAASTIAFRWWPAPPGAGCNGRGSPRSRGCAGNATARPWESMTTAASRPKWA
jgi:hypothetical protein